MPFDLTRWVGLLSGSRTHRLAWLGLALVMLVLIATAGGVLRWGVAVALTVACGAVLAGRDVAAADADGGPRTWPRLPRHAWPIAWLAGFAVLALVPLPHAVLEVLAPGKAALVAANSAALGLAEPRWHALTYDVSLSLLALAKLGLGLVVALIAARLAASSHGRTNLAALVVGTASLVAVVTWINTLLAPDYLWGFLRSPVTGVLTSPLLNLNHLAAMLGVAAPLALALAVRAQGRGRRWWGVAFVLLVATVLASASRGGLLGLCVALVVALPLIVSRERLRLRHVRRAQLLVMIAALGLVLTIWAVASQSLSHELANTSTAELSQPGSKFMVWRHSVELLRQAPVFGVGAGAFEVAFSQFAAHPTVRYSHPENLVVQYASELGLVGGVVMVLLWGWLMVAGWRHAKQSSLRGAAWAGLLGLLVHDQFDFSMDMPLVLAVAMACAALAIPTPSVIAAASAPNLPKPAALRRRARWQTLAAWIFPVLVGLAITWWARPPRADLAAVDLAAADVVPRLTALAVAHPADDQTWARLGEALMRRDDPRAFRVLARAVAHNPANLNAHLALGLGMSKSSARRQAPAEFAVALRLSRDVELLAYASAALRSPDEVARAVPVDRQDVAFWLRELARTERQPIAQAYARRVGELYPGAADIQLTVAETLMLVAPEAALRHAQAAEALGPSIASAVAVAYALVQNQQVMAAVAFLENPGLDQRASQPPAALPLHRARVGVGLLAAAQTPGALPALAPLIDRALAASEGQAQSAEERDHWLAQAAQWQTLQGNTAQAEYYRRQRAAGP